MIKILVLCFLCLEGSLVRSSDYQEQILQLSSGIKSIKNYIFGAGKHGAFNRLAELGDNLGNRLAGSKALEDAIDWIVDQMKTKDSFDEVYTEDVQISKWVRGTETATLTSPRRQKMPIMALGTSVGTKGPIEAEAIVVESFDELDLRKNEAKGKIVVYNQKWLGYGKTVPYRRDGASKAANYGAVAVLIKSVTDFSINSPHTGSQSYNPNITSIPTACITVEDAEMLQRFADRKINITIALDISTETFPDTKSRNVIAEIKGSTNPEQVIIFGGHIDSWDVGTGSMDDGGGCLIAWQALNVLRKLNLKTKRTIRVVLWTAEEIGLVGGFEYYNRHKNDSGNVSLIMESDNGVFKPRGIRFSGSKSANNIMQFTLDTYLKDYNMTEMVAGGASSDTGWWVNSNQVPGAELYSYNEKYFYFHHSEGDTMTVLNADDLDYATLLWSTIVYTVGNLDDMLPRGETETNGANIPRHFITRFIHQIFQWSAKF